MTGNVSIYTPEELVEIEEEFTPDLQAASTMAELLRLYHDYNHPEEIGLTKKILEKLDALPSSFKELFDICGDEYAFEDSPDNVMGQYFFDRVFALVSSADEAFSLWRCTHLESPKEEPLFAMVLALGNDWDYFRSVFYELTDDAEKGLRFRNQLRRLFDRVDELGLSPKED